MIGRLKVAEAGDALLKAVNDSQAEVRYAAMRALGAIREPRAVAALTEQFAFYKKGEGAWSALDALARIGAPASVPLFKERLQDKDRLHPPRGDRRAGPRRRHRRRSKRSNRTSRTDDAAMVRLATAFALQKLGRNYAARIVDLMARPRCSRRGRNTCSSSGRRWCRR